VDRLEQPGNCAHTWLLPSRQITAASSRKEREQRTAPRSPGSASTVLS